MKKKVFYIIFVSIALILTACNDPTVTQSDGYSNEFIIGRSSNANGSGSDGSYSSEYTDSGTASETLGQSNVQSSAAGSSVSSSMSSPSSSSSQQISSKTSESGGSDNTMTTAQVVQVNGTPRLMINGEQVQPIMIGLDGTTSNDNLEAVMNQIKVAGNNGINIVVLTLDTAGLRYKDMYIDKIYDLLQKVKNANKNAKVVLRYWIHGAPSYIGAPASAATDLWISTSGRDSSYSFCSLASKEWLEAAKLLTKNLCDLVMEDDFLNKMVIGYQPTAGDAGEWFGPHFWLGGLDMSQNNIDGFREYLRKIYPTDQALRDAWGNSTVTRLNAPLPAYNILPNPASTTIGATNQYLMTSKANRIYVDYTDYSNWLRANQINEICKVVKDTTNNKSITLSFLGYHTEVYMATSNSFGVYEILKHNYVDALGAPVSYEDRNEGGIGAFMAYASAVAASGKLWLDEADYRTPFLNSNGAPGINPVGEGQDGVGDSMPFIKSAVNAYEVGKRQIGKNMVFSTGEWYFDLVTRGWYDDNEFWKKTKETEVIAAKYQNYKKAKTPEVVFIMDEKAMSLMGDRASARQILAASRQTIYRSGLSYGFYLIDDLVSGRLSDAKLFVMMTPWRINSVDASVIKNIVQKSGKTTLWMYGGGMTKASDFNSLTGMTIDSVDQVINNGIRLVSDSSVISGVGAGPYYFVSDLSGVTALGHYSSVAGSIAAYARVTKNGWNSIFYGSTNLTPAVLAYAAETAGCTRFIGTGETGYADDHLYVLHTKTGGSKTISFPVGTTDVYEFFTNKWYSGSSIAFNAQQYKTYYFFYGQKSELQNAGIGK